MKFLSLKVPDAMDRELESRARSEGITKSKLVRRALANYLRSSSLPPAKSALALAGDLVGSLEGPGDLSISKEYFKDFGR
jgi:ribbon-helix-helix CopG family protein